MWGGARFVCVCGKNGTKKNINKNKTEQKKTNGTKKKNEKM